MVVLMMLLGLCDTDASASGIILQKGHVVSYLSCLDLRNGMVSLTNTITIM